MIEKDLEFHQKIWSMADHILLKSVLDGFRVHIAAFLRSDVVEDEDEEDLVRGCEPHSPILDSIRNKDSDMAAQHMISSLAIFANRVLDSFKQSK